MPSFFPLHFIYLFFKFIYLFNLFLAAWVFLAACVLPLVVASGGYSSLRCVGFSLRWLFLLRSMGSRHAGFRSCGLRALERRLSSCCARASLLRGMWELPEPGLEPLSPALAGGFLTTAPLGKPPPLSILENFKHTEKLKELHENTRLPPRFYN